MNISYLRILATLLIAGFTLQGCDLLPPTRLKLDRQPYPNSRQEDYPERPIAFPERPQFFEGEEIWVQTVLPATSEAAKRYNGRSIQSLLRVFRGVRELTDSLFSDSSDYISEFYPLHVRMLSPGDTMRWLVNRKGPLAVGEYWGFLDAGVKSKRFGIKVRALPDSFKKIREMHFGLLKPYRQQRMRPSLEPPIPVRESYIDSLRQYARMLLAQPVNAPLRMEGLRLCIGSGVWDSARQTYVDVVEQFVREPRVNPSEAVESLRLVCEWVLNCDSLEYIHLAQQWGGDRVVSAVMQKSYYFKHLRRD